VSIAGKTDLAIIGAGPGGYVAALRAAQLGLTVTLIESRHVGGVCLNRGCIPTKAMLRTAAAVHEVKQAAKFGVMVEGEPRIDFASALARRDSVVKRLRNGTRGLLQRAGVETVAGHASFTGPSTVRVEPVTTDDGVGRSAMQVRTVEAEHIVVATGSRPTMPLIPGVDHPRVIDSDGALALTAVPASIVVVGAGAVGCEWSQIFARLGAEVTLVEMLPVLLPRADADLSAEMARSLKRDGVTIHTGRVLRGIAEASGELEVELAEVEGGTASGATVTVRSAYVLVAAGRRPLTEGLNLEAAGVSTDLGGWIETDEWQRTSVPSVLAIGDVTGGALLAHVASRQGVIVAEKLAGLSPQPLRPNRIPFVTYTDPEVASVGLTEAEARRGSSDVVCGVFPFAADGRAVAQATEHGFVKVIADSRYGQVLGVHFAGAHAGELLSEAVLALELEATLDELATVIRSHPTMSEALGEAALAARSRALHV
jgi:dihydrolipoamide dehydrogenase